MLSYKKQQQWRVFIFQDVKNDKQKQDSAISWIEKRFSID